MSAPPPPFRIFNWIGIIDQLASSAANRLLAPLDMPLPQFILLNHFSYRPGADDGGQVPYPGVVGHHRAVDLVVDPRRLKPGK